MPISRFLSRSIKLIFSPIPSIKMGSEYIQAGTSAPKDFENWMIFSTSSLFLVLKKYLIILALLAEPPPNPAETGIFFSNVTLNLSFESLLFLQNF